ncbi:hypothetical protein C2845_PM07G28460 [Panicum miliaceum]|uniref:Uncharacterized protein n=1 Tax=Panicum miliaceum TaxID=4540 RepID=A0A3L6SQA8_PANMI|nr:hypothetical protein C2845_PM07G28460 [Panicum miliaceum]
MEAAPALTLPLSHSLSSSSGQNKQNRAEPARRPNSPGTQHLRPIPLAHGTPTSPNTSTTKSLSQPSLPTVGITNLAATIRPSSASTSPAHLGLPPLELGTKTEAPWLPNAHARFTSVRSTVHSPERRHAAAPTRLCRRGSAVRRPAQVLLRGRWPLARPAKPPAGQAPAGTAAPAMAMACVLGLGTGSPSHWPVGPVGSGRKKEKKKRKSKERGYNSWKWLNKIGVVGIEYEI